MRLVVTYRYSKLNEIKKSFQIHQITTFKGGHTHFYVHLYKMEAINGMFC